MGESPAMTMSNDTPQRATLVAVDIAKNPHDVLLNRRLADDDRLRLANNLEDFEQLAGSAKSQEFDLDRFEATGTIIDRWRISPPSKLRAAADSYSGARPYSRSDAQPWDKNDPKDASVGLPRFGRRC
jgi:hypothetical protein